jgi:hypothetical protein
MASRSDASTIARWGTRTRQVRSGLRWWVLLLAAICLEGLGRRFLPLPPAVLYFAKDGLLLAGAVAIGVSPLVASTTRRLAGPLPILVVCTAMWCFGSLVLPGHPSVLLGLFGLRQYLLWWIAPLICASALLSGNRVIADKADRALAILALVVCALGAYQFSQPVDARINAYAWDPAADVAGVSTTGRVRVSATFSYISGFANFVILMTPLLLAAAAQGRADRSRRLVYLAAGALAAASPMSGSRATVLYVAVASLSVLGLSGSFRTTRGRLALVSFVGLTTLGVWLVPDAAQGVQDRFSTDETFLRFRDLALAVPFYAIANTEYPFAGAGVGVLQNAGAAAQFDSGWLAEAEPQRILIELGLPGYLLVWLSKFTLAVALFRGGRILKRANERAWAGAAWTYAAYSMLLALTTDHVAQALFFVGVGTILARVATAHSRRTPERPER